VNKYNFHPVAFLLTLATLIWLPISKIAAQDELAVVLNKLAEKTFDCTVLDTLEARRPDPRIIPALKSAFEARGSKEEKQKIAGTLLRLGERSDAYFEFLATYVKQAVDDRSPSFIMYDSQGRFVQGQFSPTFENWCAQNGKDPRAVAALQFDVYPRDVSELAKAQDARAAALFKTGLESPHPLVVCFSVEGLGRLQDTSAIPLIRKTAERSRAIAEAIAIALPWYSWPEAESLRIELEPNKRMRDFHFANVQSLQIIELKRVLSRRSENAQK
jgi:hypothetical protein